MASFYRSADWDAYRMDYRKPHAELEPDEREIAVVSEALSEYLAYVRDPAHFRASVNVILDGEGLEVSAK